MRIINFSKLNKKIIYNILLEYLDLIYKLNDNEILTNYFKRVYFRLSNMIFNDFNDIDYFSCEIMGKKDYNFNEGDIYLRIKSGSNNILIRLYNYKKDERDFIHIYDLVES